MNCIERLQKSIIYEAEHLPNEAQTDKEFEDVRQHISYIRTLLNRYFLEMLVNRFV